MQFCFNPQLEVDIEEIQFFVNALCSKLNIFGFDVDTGFEEVREYFKVHQEVG